MKTEMVPFCEQRKVPVEICPLTASATVKLPGREALETGLEKMALISAPRRMVAVPLEGVTAKTEVDW